MFDRIGFRRMFGAAMVCILAVVMLGAGQSSDAGIRYNRIGHNLMCVCGCGQVLVECNHVGCPDSKRMIGELRDEIGGPDGAGADSLVVNWFVNKYGATVLAAPIRGGFDNVAWIVPISTFILAIFGTALVVRMWSQRRRPALANSALPQGPDDAMRDRIRRETEWR